MCLCLRVFVCVCITYTKSDLSICLFCTLEINVLFPLAVLFRFSVLLYALIIYSVNRACGNTTWRTLWERTLETTVLERRTRIFIGPVECHRCTTHWTAKDFAQRPLCWATTHLDDVNIMLVIDFTLSNTQLHDFLSMIHVHNYFALWSFKCS